MVEGEAAEARLERMRRKPLVGERRARADTMALDLGLAEAARRKAHDDAGNAAVADQEVRAEADDGHRHLLRHGAHQERKVFRVGRQRQDFGRTAGAEPDDRRKRRVCLQGAAKPGEVRAQSVEKMLRHERRAHPDSTSQAPPPTHSPTS